MNESDVVPHTEMIMKYDYLVNSASFEKTEKMELFFFLIIIIVKLCN